MDELKSKIERMKLIQETVDCIRNTFNRDTESDKVVCNCMALVQNAIDGEYHDMEEVDVSKLERPQGEWIKNEGRDLRDCFYTCSKCGRNINVICGETLADYPFCHCGASMIGGETE